MRTQQKPFAQIVEKVEKEKPAKVKYKLIQDDAWDGDEARTICITQDLETALAKFVKAFKRLVGNLEDGNAKVYLGNCGWTAKEGVIENMNSWKSFFAALQDCTLTAENGGDFYIETSDWNYFFQLELLKKINELDPDLLDEQIPFCGPT